MEDTHANPLFFSDNPLLLLLFEETSRAKKADPYHQWVALISSILEKLKTPKKART